MLEFGKVKSFFHILILSFHETFLKLSKPICTTVVLLLGIGLHISCRYSHKIRSQKLLGFPEKLREMRRTKPRNRASIVLAWRRRCSIFHCSQNSLPAPSRPTIILVPFSILWLLNCRISWKVNTIYFDQNRNTGNTGTSEKEKRRETIKNFRNKRIKSDKNSDLVMKNNQNKNQIHKNEGRSSTFICWYVLFNNHNLMSLSKLP